MIELGKKYKLKKIKGFESFEIGFYNLDTAICENPYGERFVFLKEFFLIDPAKPNEIYSNLILERK